MTSYELQLKIQEFLQNQESQYLQEILYKTSTMFQTFTEATFSHYINRGDTKRADEAATPPISDISLELRKISPRKLFRQIDLLKNQFEKLDFPRVFTFFYEVSENPEILFNKPSDSTLFSFSNFNDLTNKFELSYEEFLERSNVSNIFTTLRYGNDLYSIILITRFLLEDIFDKLTETSIQKLSDNQEELSIFLHSGNNLEILISKLSALSIIYAELCRLLNVSTAEYPLKIIKIESGSLWIKLFGESKVIAFMTDSIKEVASFLYRNFTNEGKLNSIPNQLEGIDATLKLEAKLRESGYDTTGMKESIAKSAAVIAKNQNIFLSGEAEVKINEESFSVGSTIDKLIAERMQIHLLEGESDETKLLGNGNANEE